MLGKVVDAMSTDSNEFEMDCVALSLQLLGSNHANYGVSRLHLRILETAVLRALAKLLQGRNKWTDSVQRGWSTVLKFIANAMMAGFEAGGDLKVVPEAPRRDRCAFQEPNEPFPEEYPHTGTLRLEVTRISRGTHPARCPDTKAKGRMSNRRSQDMCRPRCTQSSVEPNRNDLKWDPVGLETCVFTDKGGTAPAVSAHDSIIDISPIGLDITIRPIRGPSEPFTDTDSPPKRPQRRRSFFGRL
jgi:hypothetical protein